MSIAGVCGGARTWLVVPLGPPNLVTGANGSGKSTLSSAAAARRNRARRGVAALAREGGLHRRCGRARKVFAAHGTGEHQVEGGPRKEPVALRMGFASTISVMRSISACRCPAHDSAFALDLRSEAREIWAGRCFVRPRCWWTAAVPLCGARRKRRVAGVVAPLRGSTACSPLSDPRSARSAAVRDASARGASTIISAPTGDAPARQPQVGTRTPYSRTMARPRRGAADDPRDRQWQTRSMKRSRTRFRARELGITEDGRFELELRQHGLLRPLSRRAIGRNASLSALIAALLTPRPPALMVLNEPETSLHPDLLPASRGWSRLRLVHASDRRHPQQSS